MFIIVIFILLLLTSTPIAVAIGLATIVGLYQGGVEFDAVARTMFSGIDSFSLMAIPFFIFAGDIMLAGGTSKRLIDFAKKLVGWTTGGLPIAGVIASMFFAALSGSSPATVAAIGGIMIPSLKEAKYSARFSVGLMCAAGSLGIIIPPSITFLVYGVIAEVSISELFIAGIIPGLLIGFTLIVVSYIIAKRQGHKPAKRGSIKEVLIAGKEAIWGLLMPLFVLGGIYIGLFTPTEAAAVAIIYGLIIGFFVYKELSLKILFNVTKKTTVISSMIMLVISTAKVFSWYLTFEQLPARLASSILEYATNPIMIFLFVNIILLIIGMFMDTSAAILIMAPLFLPVVIEMGISPIHFGVVMVVNLAIGMLTPPLGLNLYVASGISKMSITEITKGAIPFIFVLIFTLGIITFVPALSTYLPSLIYSR